jgi:peptidoglycan/LPS O-acetylase OafA/YrhL
LTGLRAVLALWVILHHLTGPGMLLDAWSRGLPRPAVDFLHNGYLAVAVFFVLSGFVLARGYERAAWGAAGLIRYAIARFARIYPVYLLSILTVSPFIAAERIPSSGERLFHDKVSLLANYGLLLQGWTGKLPVAWNTPAWSLSCEVFFYLCFPLLAAWLPGMTWRAVAVVVTACMFAGYLPQLGVPAVWKPVIHLADFVMGIAAARAYAMLAERRLLHGRGYWLYGPALLCTSVLVAWPGMLPGRMELNTPLRLLSGALLAGFALGGGLPVRLLSTSFATLLGQASYSMYILHVPLLWWFTRLTPRLPVGLKRTTAGFAFIGLAVLLSILVFRFVEEPANRCIRRR